jgi:hypothetical protein
MVNSNGMTAELSLAPGSQLIVPQSAARAVELAGTRSESAGDASRIGRYRGRARVLDGSSADAREPMTRRSWQASNWIGHVHSQLRKPSIYLRSHDAAMTQNIPTNIGDIMNELADLVQRLFDLPELNTIQQISTGSINETYLLDTPTAKYIAQRLNPIFTPNSVSDRMAVGTFLEGRGWPSSAARASAGSEPEIPNAQHYIGKWRGQHRAGDCVGASLAV